MNLNIEAAWTRLQGMLQSLITAIPNVVIGAGIFVLFVFAAGLSRRAVHSLTERAGHQPGTALVFSRLASWGVLALGGLVALTVIIPELNAASLFGALGVSGIAIGFAFKDIFQNLLAGLLILLTRPFRIGDQIVSGDHEGTVEDIQVRATLIRTYDNRQVVIPNSELFTNRVVVNTAYEQRRLDVGLTVGFDEDLATVKRIILEAVAGLRDVLEDPAPRVVVRTYDDLGVNLEVRFWIEPPVRREAILAQDEVLEAVVPALREAGITPARPTRHVLLRREGGGPPPEEAGQAEWVGGGEGPRRRSG
ncbi:mechanosensitive ion channel family protein [Deinococcus aestuarii]|uniref:mechanosensitive ion channel family protein n=1 Tax=Deinococcus aestuarii TaxID=2774531 RepID=UPI001C0AB036|nr:mechanosensitive ion channel domain-containing protein [Deinococcus aestuarii]